MEAKDTRKQANPCSLMFITSYITYSWVFPEMLGCGGSQPEGGRYKLWSSSIETRQCLVLALETLDQPHSTMVQPSSQTRERLVCLYVRLVHSSTQCVRASVLRTPKFLMNKMLRSCSRNLYFDLAQFVSILIPTPITTKS